MNTFFLNLGAMKNTHHAKYTYEKSICICKFNIEVTAYTEIVINTLSAMLFPIDINMCEQFLYNGNI